MEFEFNEAEVKCVKCLAKAFAEGRLHADMQKGDWESVGVTAENYNGVLSIMEEYGLISKPFHHGPSRFLMFTVEPKAMVLARAIENKELEDAKGKDIVESIKITLKRHPVTAWSFLGFTAFGAIRGTSVRGGRFAIRHAEGDAAVRIDGDVPEFLHERSSSSSTISWPCCKTSRSSTSNLNASAHILLHHHRNLKSKYGSAPEIISVDLRIIPSNMGQE